MAFFTTKFFSPCKPTQILFNSYITLALIFTTFIQWPRYFFVPYIHWVRILNLKRLQSTASTFFENYFYFQHISISHPYIIYLIHRKITPSCVSPSRRNHPHKLHFTAKAYMSKTSPTIHFQKLHSKIPSTSTLLLTPHLYKKKEKKHQHS